MHRAPSRLPLPPTPDTLLVEPAQTLQPSHMHLYFKLLEADRTLRVVYAVLLRRLIWEHPRPPWLR